MSENKYVTTESANKANAEETTVPIKYYTMDTRFGGLFGILCFILVLIATIIVIGYLVQYTWNMTLPEIFGIKEITMYQAIGLFILSGLLFKK